MVKYLIHEMKECKVGIKLYSDRESNSDLLFRRELFYPLNYQSKPFKVQSYNIYFK